MRDADSPVVSSTTNPTTPSSTSSLNQNPQMQGTGGQFIHFGSYHDSKIAIGKFPLNIRLKALLAQQLQVKPLVLQCPVLESVPNPFIRLLLLRCHQSESVVHRRWLTKHSFNTSHLKSTM